MNSYLNIAAGKLLPIDFSDNNRNFLVQLDTMYQRAVDVNNVEGAYNFWLEDNKGKERIIYCNDDVFNFLAYYKNQFDFISCYRFLEHVTKPEIQGFIYLLSTAIKVGGIVDIIVPNFKTLASLLLEETINEKIRHQDWERHDTLLTYELLNEPTMPHASIWTVDRIIYFFELEERFVVESIDPAYEFDGRNIYIRAKIKRVK